MGTLSFGSVYREGAATLTVCERLRRGIRIAVCNALSAALKHAMLLDSARVATLLCASSALPAITNSARAGNVKNAA